MNEELTIEKLLNLPNIVLDIASKNNIDKCINMLSDTTCNIYYYSNLKKDLKRFFDKFNDSKYSYGIIKYSIGASKNYGLREEKFLKNVNDNVGNLVARKMDDDIYTKDVYEMIIKFANGLTYKEAKYFARSFLENKTDENICEEFGISRTGLQRIRKSCLVKMYLIFPIEKN